MQQKEAKDLFTLVNLNKLYIYIFFFCFYLTSF